MTALKRRLALILATVALMVVLAAPASAQTINVSPTVGTGDILSNNNTTVQCIGDPLVDLGTTVDVGEDQCADDGGSNTDGGLF